MEQIDTLLNGYKLIQDKEKFMYGIDAVLLSGFALSLVNKGDSLVDLGTGTGIIPLLLQSVSKGKEFTGLEVQTESAQMAQKSVELNNLPNVRIITGDIKNVNQLFLKHSVEIVTCNPPYMINEHGRQCGTDAKSIARHEVLCTLDDVISAAEYLLKPHGTFCMIHRPFRLPEIFTTLAKYLLEPKRMQLIYPFADKEPNMVLIEAKKNAQPWLKNEPPLIVRESSGEYTKQVDDIYNLFRGVGN